MKPLSFPETLDFAHYGAIATRMTIYSSSPLYRIATVANAEQTLLYWRLGKRIRTEVLGGDRAIYGGQIVVTVQCHDNWKRNSKKVLEKKYGEMVQFAEVFPDEAIVVSLLQQLGWAHFLALLPIKEPLAREFYAELSCCDPVCTLPSNWPENKQHGAATIRR